MERPKEVEAQYHAQQILVHTKKLAGLLNEMNRTKKARKEGETWKEYGLRTQGWAGGRDNPGPPPTGGGAINFF